MLDCCLLAPPEHAETPHQCTGLRPRPLPLRLSLRMVRNHATLTKGLYRPRKRLPYRVVALQDSIDASTALVSSPNVLREGLLPGSEPDWLRLRPKEELPGREDRSCMPAQTACGCQ